MSTLILNYLVEVLILIGIIYVFGYIIYLINRIIIKLGFDSKIYIYTGVVGTVVHELSHAVMCLLFFHKITDMKLFSPSDDGTLGYVSHSYNKKNIYQQIGNYFIGVAPIIGGTIVIYLLMWLLLPNTFDSVLGNNTALYNYISSGNYQNILGYLFINVKTIFSDFTNWKLYIFLILSVFICLHLNLSNADVKGSLVAIPLILIILLIVNIVLFFIFKSAYIVFFKFIISLGTYLFAFLFISLILALFILLFFILLKIIKTIIIR